MLMLMLVLILGTDYVMLIILVQLPHRIMLVRLSDVCCRNVAMLVRGALEGSLTWET